MQSPITTTTTKEKKRIDEKKNEKTKEIVEIDVATITK